MIDVLGDQMKALERASAGATIPPSQPIYIRIDGRGFSRFTKGMRRPFDARMTLAMQKTADHIMGAMHANAAYTQSDEISLVWAPRPEGEHPFGGKPQKLTSVLAGLATAAFTKALLEDTDGLSGWVSRLPHFDARVVAMPSTDEAAAMFAWRGQDAKRNGINQIARSTFSHHELQGKSSYHIREMLMASGKVSIEDIDEAARNGSLFYQSTSKRGLTDAEIARIPEKHRPLPGDLFERTRRKQFTSAHPGVIQNLKQVMFCKAEPQKPEKSIMSHISSPSPFPSSWTANRYVRKG